MNDWVYSDQAKERDRSQVLDVISIVGTAKRQNTIRLRAWAIKKLREDEFNPRTLEFAAMAIMRQNKAGAFESYYDKVLEEQQRRNHSSNVEFYRNGAGQ